MSALRFTQTTGAKGFNPGRQPRVSIVTQHKPYDAYPLGQALGYVNSVDPVETKCKTFPTKLVTRIKTWGKIIGEALERYIHQLRAHRQRGADGGGQGVDLTVPQGARHPSGTIDR